MTKRSLIFLLLTACPSSGLDLVAPQLLVRVDASEQGAVDFGEVVVTNRATRTLIFENAGRADLTIESAEFQGDAAFAHSDVPTTLPVGEQAKVVVSFAPSAAGDQRGAITLRTNEPKRKDVLISIAGRGIDPALRVCAPPLDLIDQNCRAGGRHIDFGKTIIGQSRTRRVNLRAIGGSDVAITDIAVRYLDPPKCRGFELAAAPLTLAPHGSQDIEITFAPRCEATFRAELSFETTDPRNPAPRVQIEGIGEPDCVARSESYTPRIEYDNKVDVLFVLDDSVSMQYIQATVKQYAASFISKLDDPQKPMDFQIGVVTTDLDKVSRRGKLVQRTVAAGAFTETLHVITHDSLKNAPNPADRGPVRAFQLLMEAIDTSGSANEFGFATAGAALATGAFSYQFNGLTRTIPGAADLAFLRPDARLAVIILSDEDDSTGAISLMASTLKSLAAARKPRIAGAPDDFQLFAVVDPSATLAQGCPQPAGWQPGDPPYSYGGGTPIYHQGVAAFGPSARVVPLCSDFPVVLADLADSIARPQCTFEIQGGVVTIDEASSLCISGGRCFAAGEYSLSPPTAAHPNGTVTLSDSACPTLQTVLQFDYTSCHRTLDRDSDTVPDLMDVCPALPDDQADSDSDGLGDACD